MLTQLCPMICTVNAKIILSLSNDAVSTAEVNGWAPTEYIIGEYEGINLINVRRCRSIYAA